MTLIADFVRGEENAARNLPELTGFHRRHHCGRRGHISS